MDKLLGGGAGCMSWCMERKGRGYYKVQGIKGDHLYAHTENTKELDLVLRDELGKCDENGSLECRLTVVVHVISGWELETEHTYVRVLCGKASGSPQTYKKRLLPITAHSSQLKANAMALEIVRVIVMNLSVSTAPQRRSR